MAAVGFDISSLLQLLSVPGVGPLKLRALVKHFGDPATALAASPIELHRVPGIDRNLARTIAHHRAGEAFAREQLRKANRLDVRLVSAWDDAYPSLLNQIYDPPPIIYVRGTLPPPETTCIAIVGTRRPSAYGLAIAERFSTELCARNITVVSGLARGIDTAAHRSSIQARGQTVAVIGSGIDVPYPAENARLMERIASNGVVVSEFPLGAKPDAQNFPRRNRIISGLSRGTIVIESNKDGGAMITAAMALDQNREVFAVPGMLGERGSAGPHQLIQQGRAKLVESIDDVLGELNGLGSPSQPPSPPPELTLFEQRIFDCLDLTPLHIDVIAERAGTQPSDALVQLLGLEFKGLVKQLQGKYFVRA